MFHKVVSVATRLRCGGISSDHYCATLCVSVVFAVARCLSVCLSVTLVYCIQMAEDMVKLFSRPSSVDSSFLTPSADTQFPGEPFSGGTKYKGVGKFLQFSTEIAVYLRNGTR